MQEKISAERGARKSKNMLKRQRIAVIILIVAVALLVAGLVAVYKIVENIPVEFIDPNDDTLYYIKKVDGEYALYTEAGQLCSVTDDKYYVTSYGTLVYINPSTGEYYVDAGRELIFPQLYYDAYNSSGTALYTKDKIIDRVSVSNMHGEYSFVRDKINKFKLEGHPDVSFTNEAFVYLTMACAYPLSTMKLEAPKTLPNGEINWAEYGLSSEQRTEIQLDEDGEEIEVTYDYSPAKATLTTASGEEYTLYFGDPTITGKSYYVRYEQKNAVYILASTAITDYLLCGIESVISPSIVYPMSSTGYTQVENFIIYESIDYAKIDELMREKFGDFNFDMATDADIAEYEAYYRELFEKYSVKACHFSYQDLEQRENSMYASLPYVSFLEYSSGYYINTTNVSMMLQDLYETNFVGTQKLAPTDDELAEYGLLTPDKIISFTYYYFDEKGERVDVYNKVYISKQNSDGSYYAYSDMFDMIVCVDESSFGFLSWTELDWYDPSFMQFYIHHLSNIIIQAPGTNINFGLDNSQTLDGTYFPLTENTFTDGDKNPYEIKSENGKFNLYSAATKLEPVYHSDFLVLGIPFTQGVPQGQDFLLCEIENVDSNEDGVDDAYIYYYYNITYHEGKYVLYVSVAPVDLAGELIAPAESYIMDVAYSTDCFVTDGFSQYAFLVREGSQLGDQLESTYANAGGWLDSNIFITAKGSYLLVDGKTGMWAQLASVSNNVYIADKDSGKLQASGVYVSDYGANEVAYPTTGEILSYNQETKMLQLYSKESGTRRDAAKSEVAPGIWGSGDFYVSLTGDLICLDSNTGEAGTFMLDSTKYIASVYANGKELNYTFPSTDSLGNTEIYSATHNFQQFYSGILYGSFEGMCDLSEEEMAALRELDDFSDTDPNNPCIMKMTVFAKDPKGNEKYLVFRFYRISERKAYVTVEALDSPTAESNPENAYGSFYVLKSYVDKIISDANKVLDGTEVTAISKY